MTRIVFLVLAGLIVVGDCLAQTTPPRTAPVAGPAPANGSYYAPAERPPAAGPAPARPGEAQPIRRTGGETPLNNNGIGPQPAGNPQPQPGNVIRPPQAGGANVGVGPLSNPNASAVPGPAAVGNPNGAVRPAAPFQLAPAEEKYVNDLLANWENRSGQIQRFRCEFQRWEYDPAGFGPKDPNTPRSYAKGKIKYQTPDKGLFQVEEAKVFEKMNGAKPQFAPQNAELLEHWVCDGQNVFEFDARNKVLRQRQLPPDMQGKAIADGPLPFLFGAKAEKMKARYWIRSVEKEEPKTQDVYWLEVFPKTRGDANNFKMVHIALDKNDFMPRILMLFPPNYDPQKNSSYATYVFDKNEANWDVNLEKVRTLWAAAFYEPKTPAGWKKIVEPFFGDPGPNPGQGQAQKPAVPGVMKINR